MAYHGKTGYKRTLISKHPHQAYVKQVAASSTDLVASCDLNSLVQVWRLDLANSATVRVTTLATQIRLSAPRQLVFSPSGKFILVSTATLDPCILDPNGSLIGSKDFERGDTCAWRWLTLIKFNKLDEFVLIYDSQFLSYTATEFPSLTPAAASMWTNKTLDYLLGDGCSTAEFDIGVQHTPTQTLVLAVRHHAGRTSGSNL